MTNAELYLKFAEILTNDYNVFEKRCALKDMENDYMTTEFFKKFPEVDVIGAYELFYKEETGVNKLVEGLKEQLSVVFSNLTNNLDENFLNKFDNETLNMLKELAKQYSIL